MGSVFVCRFGKDLDSQFLYPKMIIKMTTGNGSCVVITEPSLHLTSY